MDAQIQEVANWLNKAERIAILTGAGVSKESGVPTFRDAMEGLWSKYEPTQLATPQAFQANPSLVWDWYTWRRELVSQAKPNNGHYALAELQKMCPNTTLITQNVDDLHEQAGSHDVAHLHGNIAKNRCFFDCQGHPTYVDIDFKEGDKSPPKCPYCGRWVRPDVVWFGEALPAYELRRAQKASEECHIMLVIGTSGMVMPASQLPLIAKRKGATLIEVNPTKSEISFAMDIVINAPSGEALPKIIEAMQHA